MRSLVERVCGKAELVATPVVAVVQICGLIRAFCVKYAYEPSGARRVASLQGPAIEVDVM